MKLKGTVSRMLFQEPELEVVTFEKQDVIATSGYCDGAPIHMGQVYGSGCNFDPDAPDD